MDLILFSKFSKGPVLLCSELTSGDYQGTIVASGIGGGVRYSPATTVVVLGGTGVDSTTTRLSET
jgi:hypothetical protein